MTQQNIDSSVTSPQHEGKQPSPELEHRIEIIFDTRGEAVQAFDAIETALFELGQIGTMCLTSYPAAQPTRQETISVTDEHSIGKNETNGGQDAE